MTGQTPLSRAELQRRAVSGALWTLLHTVVSLPLAFLVNVVVARVLGVVDYGRLAYLTTVMALAGAILSAGVGTGLLQFGAKAHASGNADEVRSLLSASQGFRLYVVAPILSIVVVAMTDVPGWLLGTALVFGVLIPSAFGGSLASLGIENRTARVAQNAMIVNLVTQAAVLAAVLIGQSADSVWAARLAMGSAGVLLALPFVDKSYRRAVLRPSLPRHFPQGFWRFSLPAGAASIVATMVADRSEVLFLTWLPAPVEAAGIFGLAFGLINHLFGPAQALLGPLIPAVAGLREVDESAVGPALLRSLRGSSTIVALLIAGAVPALAILTIPIYGPSYQGVPEVLVAFGVAGGFMIVSGPIQAFVQARLSGNRLLAVNLIAVVVDVVLMLLLIPSMGVWGAVLGNAGAATTKFLILLAGERRALNLSWSLVGRACLPLLFGNAMSIGLWFGVKAAGIPSVPGAIAAAIVGIGLVIGLIRLGRTGLTPGDADAVLDALPQRLRRVTAPMIRLCIGNRLPTGTTPAETRDQSPST